MLIVIFEKMKRSSRPEVFCEKGFRRNFTKFTGDSDTGFPVNFEKFLITTFLTEHLWLLLLYEEMWDGYIPLS